ncbi:MAG: SpoIIE family protein phosphatase [Acidobacteriaceae bacterium]|nr:SpoIIE family protein phosphatase [Acidobacteriaceae bacterium]
MKLQRAAQLITSTLDLDALLDRVVNDLAAAIGCVEVSVWLQDRESNDIVLRGVRGCTMHQKGARLKIGQEGMVGHTAATGRTRYAPDVSVDPHYIPCEPDIQSEVDLPMIAGGKVIGVMNVSHCRIDAFSETDLQVLEALAGHVAVAVENAHLFAREREERERMIRETEEARAIQRALFGRATPLIPGLAFETAWHPAGILAGDWFDFIDLGNQKHGIVLADVSGKGMPAALLMSATRALLRSVARDHASPGQTLTRLSQTLADDFPANKFVTMIYGVLDAPSREITLASAGHPRPLLVNGKCSFVEMETGLPLGMGVSSYPEHTLTLESGTKVLLYTDGITEAMSESFEEYGPGRLIEHFLQPDACVDGLIEEIKTFGARCTLTDDVTAMLIRSR